MQKTIRSGDAEPQRKAKRRLSEVQIKENQQNDIQSQQGKIRVVAFRKFRKQQRPQQFRLLFLFLIKLLILRTLSIFDTQPETHNTLRLNSPGDKHGDTPADNHHADCSQKQTDNFGYGF